MTRMFRPFYVGTIAVVGVAVIGSSFVPKVKADTWNKMSIVTVNEPVIAGNKVLDPGTYVWKLMDSQSNRHIVQIFDKDQQHLETTVLAIPNYRLQPAGNSQFAFWETPAGVPKAVRAWFYPGDNFGQEFAYPKKLVAQLASAVPTPIPMNYREPGVAETPAAVPELVPDAPVNGGPIAPPAPPPAQLAEASRPHANPTAQAVTAPAVATPAHLPHTASFNPAIGLLGLLSLSMAGMLTVATRKI